MPTDGLTAHFTLRSDVGTFKADGLEMLRIRVAKIPAIVELTQTSKTKVFTQALATNAAAPVTAAGQMVMDAVNTVKGLPAGVGRFFDRVGLGAQKRLRRLQKRLPRVRRPAKLPRARSIPPGTFWAMSRSGEGWRKNSTSPDPRQAA